MNPAPATGIPALIATAAQHGRPRLAAIALITLLSAAAEGAGLVLMVPLLRILGVGPITPHDTGLGVVLAGYLILVACAALSTRARTVSIHALRIELVDDLKCRLHDALLRLDWAVFQSLRGSDVTDVLSADLNRTGQCVERLAALLAGTGTAAISLGIATVLSPALTLAALALFIALIPILGRQSRRALDFGRRETGSSRSAQAIMADDLTGLRLIRGFGAEQDRSDRYRSALAGQRRLQMDFLKEAANADSLVRALAVAASATGLVIAIRIFGMETARALVFLLAFGRMAQAIARLQDGWRRVANLLPSFEAAIMLLNEWTARAEPPAGPPPPAPSRDIRLCRVSLRRGRTQALSEIDAVIPANAITAIAGPSGAGKSSLADILLGLLRPDTGQILIDGHPLDPGSSANWRHHIGYVPQDSFLFHDSIRANLRLARPDATEEELWTALDLAAAADMVRGLPDGLDHVAGDRGERLSGGQRQRLALARALVRRPSVLILDEATAALDAGTEDRILDSLRNLKRQMTIVIIAHRPRMLHEADHLILLDGGRVAACGPAAAVAAGPGV